MMICSNQLSQYKLLTLVALIVIQIQSTNQQYLQETLSNAKIDPFYLDLFHKFDSDVEFRQRGSILVKPKTENHAAQALFVQQNELSQDDLNKFKQAYEKDEKYHLKTIYRNKKEGSQGKVAQTLVKACTLYVTNLTDTLLVNLSPTNEFISINLYTAEPECLSVPPSELSVNKFTTTLSIEAGAIGPQPDTVTYIKRLEEERQNKLKEGKEDNRSFFAKYWIYIVPAVIILMMMSGPEAQGAR